LNLVIAIACAVDWSFTSARKGLKSKWPLHALIRAALYLLLLQVYCYLANPAQTGPYSVMTIPIIGFLMVTSVWEGLRENKFGPTIPPLFGLLGMIYFLFSGSDMFASQQKVQLAGQIIEKEWTPDVQPIDPRHIQMVTWEQAQFRGATALSEGKDRGLSSRFSIGAYTKQKVGSRLMWVAPLDYAAFRHWQSSECTPAYVQLSAEDASERPELIEEVDGKPLCMKYMPEAYFGNNLERYVWNNGYSNYVLDGYHLELDDSGRPFWVITLLRPTAGYEAMKVEGMVIVDPQTGKIDKYMVGAESALPEWVDRVVPTSTGEEYARAYGELRRGWWNAWWDKLDVLVPTHHQLIWGAENGECYHYYEMKGSGGTDNSRTGFILMSTKTGKSTFFRQHNGISVKAALAAANAKVAQYKGYHAADAVQFNLYGRLAYVMPILSQTHIFQYLAIVDSGEVNIEVALGKSKEEALESFRRIIAQHGNNNVSVGTSAVTKKVPVTVVAFKDILVDGRQIFYLRAKEIEGKFFSGTSELGAEFVLTLAGQQAELEFIETNDKVVPLSGFRNLSYK
jgi:hypothetical protein